MSKKPNIGEATNSLQLALNHAVEAAKKEAEYVELADLTKDDLSPEFMSGYDAILLILHDAVSRVQELRDHTHDFELEFGCCTVCGFDGNA